jgi:mRNA interferase MazF
LTLFCPIVFVDKGAGGLGKKSLIQYDPIKSLDKSRIVRKRGHFAGDILKKVDVALKVSLALT